MARHISANHYVLNIYSLHNYQHLKLVLPPHLDVQHVYKFPDVDELRRNAAAQVRKMKKVQAKPKTDDSMPSDTEDEGDTTLVELPAFQQNVVKPKPKKKANTRSRGPKNSVVATGNSQLAPKAPSAPIPTTAPHIPVAASHPPLLPSAQMEPQRSFQQWNPPAPAAAMLPPIHQFPDAQSLYPNHSVRFTEGLHLPPPFPEAPMSSSSSFRGPLSQPDDQRLAFQNFPQIISNATSIPPHPRTPSFHPFASQSVASSFHFEQQAQHPSFTPFGIPHSTVAQYPLQLPASQGGLQFFHTTLDDYRRRGMSGPSS